MQTRNIKVALRDGEMGAYLALPDRTPVGAIIAIMENYQQSDGSIAVPDVLRPYMGDLEKISA